MFFEIRKFSKQVTKTFNEIPGPKSLPFIGTLHHYLPIIGNYHFDKLHINGLKKFKKYGHIVREEIVQNVNLVWLFKPEDIETLFRVEGKYPHRRSHLALEKYRLDKPQIYNTGGLLPTNGPEWFRIRSAFQKGLSSPSSVLNFLPPTSEIVNDWLERINEIRGEKNKDYLSEISRLFLELTCMTAVDLRLNSFSKNELNPDSVSSKLMEAALVSNSCILKTDNGPQLWKKFNTPYYKNFCKTQKYMEGIAIDLLKQKLSTYKKTKNSNPKTLLENYLSSEEVDFKDITGMICDFLLAGIDTSAYTTSFLLYFLSNNPKVQENLYNESKQLLPKWETPITREILNKAQYTRAVLKESLRMKPVSVGIGRVLKKESIFSGYCVPENTVVVSQNEVSCRFEEYFENPNDFIPERWLKSHHLYRPVHPFLVLPFGHGSRSCIVRWLAEQNIKTLIIKLIRRFKIRWNGGILDSNSLLINKPDGPISLMFEERNE